MQLSWPHFFHLIWLGTYVLGLTFVKLLRMFQKFRKLSLQIQSEKILLHLAPCFPYSKKIGVYTIFFFNRKREKWTNWTFKIRIWNVNFTISTELLTSSLFILFIYLFFFKSWQKTYNKIVVYSKIALML